VQVQPIQSEYKEEQPVSEVSAKYLTADEVIAKTEEATEKFGATLVKNSNYLRIGNIKSSDVFIWIPGYGGYKDPNKNENYTMFARLGMLSTFSNAPKEPMNFSIQWLSKMGMNVELSFIDDVNAFIAEQKTISEAIISGKDKSFGIMTLTKGEVTLTVRTIPVAGVAGRTAMTLEMSLFYKN
jgi:hypothetical protein